MQTLSIFSRSPMTRSTLRSRPRGTILLLGLTLLALGSAPSTLDRPSISFIQAPAPGQTFSAVVPLTVQIRARRLHSISITLEGQHGVDTLWSDGPWNDSDRVDGEDIQGTFDSALIPYNGTYALTARATSTDGATNSATIDRLIVNVQPAPVQGLFYVSLDHLGVHVFTNVIACSFPQQDITDIIQRSVNGGPFETLTSVPWGQTYVDTSAPQGVSLSYRLVATRPSVFPPYVISSDPSQSVLV